jgi:hypothetical protein
MAPRKKEKPVTGLSGDRLPKNEQLGGQLSFPNNESLTPAQVPPMSRGEREDLQRLLRQREKVLKSAAQQRSKELLADFENQMGTIYHYDEDETWKKALEIAESEVAKAQKVVAARCAELGIPKRFAPDLDVQWYGRGENALKARRIELRKMTETRVAAIEAKAIVEIGKATIEGQLAIAASGLTSDAARAFLDKLPPIESLMPALSYEEVAGEADPPVVEQLLSPNALRQRRYRERHRNALRDGSDDGGEHGL